MTQAEKEILKKLRQKVESGEPLTKDEDIQYLQLGLNYSEDEAQLAAEISENKDPNLIID